MPWKCAAQFSRIGRFKIRKYTRKSPYFLARVQHLSIPWEKDKELEGLMANLVNQYQKIVQLSPGMPPEIAAMAKSLDEPDTLTDMVTSTINSTTKEKQEILETLDIHERLKKVTKLVNYQLEILEIGNKIQSEVKGGMDKQQRDYYLRQQLKAIRDELGETDDTSVEIEEYRKKIIEKGSRKRDQPPVPHASFLGGIHRGNDLSGLAHGNPME